MLERLDATGLSVLLIAPLAACAAEQEPTPERANWNVLLVTLDTTRADRLGCYGGTARTPHLDQVAADGARFERCQSTAGITPMSHASILTGLNNYAHGMRVFYSDEVSHRLKEDVESLPEILRDRAGYATGAVVSAYVVTEIYGLDQGFETFLDGIDVDGLDTTQQQRHVEFFDRTGSTPTQRRSDHSVSDALGWLEERSGEGRPWMLWMHLFDAHDYTVVPPQDWLDASGLDVPDTTPDAPRGRASHELREALYDPELTYMDAQLGRVLQQLRDTNQYEDTIVVITADHGQGLSEGLANHGWAKHRLLYDWCLHVPLIVKVPGERPATVVRDQVRTVDIVPTVLDALGVGSAQSVHGASLMGLLRGEAEDSPRLAYADALNLIDSHSPPSSRLPEGHADNLYAVSDGRWKLVWRREDPAAGELFDLEADPEELRNLFDLDHPAVERLRGFLDDQEAWRLEPPEDQRGAQVDATQLEQLGYVGGPE